MRLRLSPQSNELSEGFPIRYFKASMRLRLSPQSNMMPQTIHQTVNSGFNEAAAFAAEQRHAIESVLQQLRRLQ